MCLTNPQAPALVLRKVVFHRSGPWCQKGWGPLLSDTVNKHLLRTVSCQETVTIKVKTVSLPTNVLIYCEISVNKPPALPCEM